MTSPSSAILAECFSLIPYPFVGRERDKILAEFEVLRQSGMSLQQIAGLLLDVIEILSLGLGKSKSQERKDFYSKELSDLLGKLNLFEAKYKNTR